MPPSFCNGQAIDFSCIMKSAIIIGGTSGIGKALSHVLLDHDYRVAVTGIEQALIAGIQSEGRENLKAAYLDCITGNISETITELVAWMGELDLLVFSAGMANLGKDLGFDIEHRANQLNVLAFAEVADWSFRHFYKKGRGHFVGISSISGLFGSRFGPAYHAGKSYQIIYMEGLRHLMRKSKLPIYITDIRPGYVETPMTEGKKMFWIASPEKAAKQIFRLIRKKKSVGYVTRRWQIVPIFIRLLRPWFIKKL